MEPSDLTVVWSDGQAEADALLRQLVERLVGAGAQHVRLTRACPRCGSSGHGRPVVVGEGREELSVSLSRSADMVVVAASTRGPVGVDVEKLDAPRFAGFDDIALHPGESAPTVEARARTWVRKESLLKATGDALHVDPRLVRLSDPDLPPELVEWAAPGPPSPHAWMTDLEIAGHAACVTVLSEDAPRITLQRAAAAALRP